MRCNWRLRHSPSKQPSRAPSNPALCRRTSPAPARVLRRVPPEMRCWLDFSGTFKSCRKVGHQIRGIFDSDGNPQQPGTYSRAQSRGFFHAGVRHARRMRDEALHPAQRLGESEAFESGEECLDRGLGAMKLETQHRTEAALLAPRNVMPRMVGQTRIVHTLDAGMPGQVIDD